MIDYKVNNAAQEDIFLLLKDTSDDFIPPLKERIDLNQYALKIFKNAEKFEAWSDGVLSGLVAAYFNDINRHKGYITSVSVKNDISGSGVGSELLKMCIAFARKIQFSEIHLEVNTKNHKAIHVYKKLGFCEQQAHNDMIKMKLHL